MNRQIETVIGNPVALGVNKTFGGYNFAIVSEECEITLNLYEKGQDVPKFVVKLDEGYKFGNVFAVEISGVDFDNLYYNYTIGDRVVLDPYAGQVCDVQEFGQVLKEKGYHSKVKPDEFDWEGDKQLYTPYNDTIIYKMHVRGFTKHVSSKVKKKGTFSGVIEKIPYLCELGITAVELMPVFEFEEVQKWTENDKNSLYNPQFNGKVNYWGYGKGMYFAPKAAYSANGTDFKNMVKALHKAGIEVIVEMFFAADAGINMIKDCVRHWVLEYHIDGVHINCNSAVLEVLKSDPILARVKLLTHYWGDCGRRSYKNLAHYNSGFMDTARKLLKGDENQLNEFVMRVKNNESNCAIINYIANNNGFTLMDLVSYDRKHNENNGENNRDGEDFNNSWNCGVEGKCRKKKILDLRKRQIKNALLMLMLSQGTPLIMAGDEFGNSQLGNNNPYCQDNDITWLNWKNLESNKDIFNFVKALIAFRKEHGILHMKDSLRDMDYKSCGYPDISYHSDNAWFASFENYNRHLGLMYCGQYGTKADGSPDDYIYVAYNLHWERHSLALPTLPDGCEWQVAISSAEEKCGCELSDRTIEVPERAIVVLLGKGK